MSTGQPLAAVTGIAAICTLGADRGTVRRALAGPRPAPSKGARLSPQALDYPFFAVPDSCFAHERTFSVGENLELALQAAGQALADANLAEHDAAAPVGGAPLPMAVVVGTTSATALHFLDGYRAVREGRLASGAQARDCRDYLHANPALALASRFNLAGAPITLSNACVSGADAIGVGLALIRAGLAERVLAGGVDTLSLVPHTGFARLLIYDSEPCRPFDRTRAGLTLGEAAAFLVLEREDLARARQQPILGRVLGYGSHNDAHHFTCPHPEGAGLEAAVRDALAMAAETGWPADAPASAAPADRNTPLPRPSFVNVHGTGTRENDRIEGRTLHRLLPDTPLWCTKGLTGHTLGAAGALEAVFTLWALQDRMLPASMGFADPDPEIGVAPVCRATPVDGRIALSTSLGFGGCNSALVLGAGEEHGR